MQRLGARNEVVMHLLIQNLCVQVWWSYPRVPRISSFSVLAQAWYAKAAVTTFVMLSNFLEKPQ